MQAQDEVSALHEALQFRVALADAAVEVQYTEASIALARRLRQPINNISLMESVKTKLYKWYEIAGIDSGGVCDIFSGGYVESVALKKAAQIVGEVVINETAVTRSFLTFKSWCRLWPTYDCSFVVCPSYPAHLNLLCAVASVEDNLLPGNAVWQDVVSAGQKPLRVDLRMQGEFVSEVGQAAAATAGLGSTFVLLLDSKKVAREDFFLCLLQREDGERVTIAPGVEPRGTTGWVPRKSLRLIHFPHVTWTRRVVQGLGGDIPCRAVVYFRPTSMVIASGSIKFS